MSLCDHVSTLPVLCASAVITQLNLQNDMDCGLFDWYGPTMTHIEDDSKVGVLVEAWNANAAAEEKKKKKKKAPPPLGETSGTTAGGKQPAN